VQFPLIHSLRIDPAGIIAEPAIPIALCSDPITLRVPSFCSSDRALHINTWSIFNSMAHVLWLSLIPSRLAWRLYVCYTPPLTAPMLMGVLSKHTGRIPYGRTCRRMWLRPAWVAKACRLGIRNIKPSPAIYADA
jgi:hypothetical protein